MFVDEHSTRRLAESAPEKVRIQVVHRSEFSSVQVFRSHLGDTRELILIPSFCQDENCTMQGVMKLARSGSLLVEEIFGGRRRSHQAEVDPAEITYESGFNGEIV